MTRKKISSSPFQEKNLFFIMRIFVLIRSFFPFALGFLSFSFFSPHSFSWGGRGHQAICESAVFLVQNPELKKFLTFRPHFMGHLCNVPDIYWKSLPASVAQQGSPTHYLDMEFLQHLPDDKKTNFAELEKILTGTKPLANKPSIKSVNMDVGSVWWRANQFLQLASNLNADFTKNPPPSNRKEDFDDEYPFNKTTFSFMTMIGLLGHFVGDNSQPLHLSVDYDAYDAGHGGLHSYFEEDMVAQFDANLVQLITDKAREMKKKHDRGQSKISFLMSTDPILQMKALSEISFSELPALLKADRVIQKSTIKEDQGMQIKTPAQRNPASQEFPRFKNMIINQMARSSLLLATFWDKAFQNAGSPLISKYKAYKYPFTPDYIAPDYVSEPKKPTK